MKRDLGLLFSEIDSAMGPRKLGFSRGAVMARKALFRGVMVAIVWYLTSIVLEFRLLTPTDDNQYNETNNNHISNNNNNNNFNNSIVDNHNIISNNKDKEQSLPNNLPITDPPKEMTKDVPQNTGNLELSVGKVYSARACHLEPGWGGGGTTTAKTCVGSKPTIKTTTAKHLTCDNEKPNLQQRPHAGFTIAMLYFAKPSYLFKQLETFASYPVDIQQSMTLLIIDDGSPAGLRVSDYLNVSTYSAPFRIRLATVVTERNWNIGGARNLAFYLSDTPKTLLLDLDILIRPKVIQEALTWPLLDKATGKQLAHRFNRHRPDGSERVHPAICVIGTDAYWENGGCDEDFVGNYGFTDVHFWYRWKADPAKELVDHTDVYLREFHMPVCDPDLLGDKATLCKDARSNLKAPSRSIYKNFALMKEKKKKGCWSNKYLRFRWVLEN